ncbi:hypothetical protein N0V85_006035 [Neurospora sp. IMI 360204]|nr:hypothetical protein N0V85_006035 [Neurospora sp. IMI 360204]
MLRNDELGGYEVSNTHPALLRLCHQLGTQGHRNYPDCRLVKTTGCFADEDDDLSQHFAQGDALCPVPDEKIGQDQD